MPGDSMVLPQERTREHVPPIVTIIQARFSSMRLPGKVLMPLGDGLVLDQVIRRAVPFSRQVVVCTSDDANDDSIEAFCSVRDIVCVRGCQDDVFMCYRQTLCDPRVESSAWFARVTGDCPLLSTDLAHYVIDRIQPGDDYSSVVHDSLPRGLAAEFINTETFMGLNPADLDGPAREHVTLYLYENRDHFRCRFVEPPDVLQHPELRLTLDYEEDYALLTALFEAKPDLSAEDAVEKVTNSAELRQINAHCVQRAARPAP